MSVSEEAQERLHSIGARHPETQHKEALPGVYIRTYGCQMNAYDSEKMQKILEGKYRPVEHARDAELIILNTCSVRDKPEQKVYSALGEFHDLKRERPEIMIGVGGCVAQQEGRNIIQRSKIVDFVFGTHNLSLLPSLIEQRHLSAQPQVAVDYRDEWEDLPLGFQGDGRVCVPIAISRGCDKNCAYCIVPTTRGREVSRAEDEILREAKIAVHRGAREILLLGQTVNSWGKDFSQRRRFTELLQKLSEIPALERIRFISPHPQDVREDFIHLVTENPKIARHIHLPLQSGSDRILKLMNRNYRRKRYLEIVGALRARVPDMSITTDVIVGFPGEKREDFEDTLAVLHEVQFDASYSYQYSPRPGTAAEHMEGTVSPEESLARLQEYQAQQDAITSARLAAWIGRDAEVLLESWSRYHAKNNVKTLQGRISQNILVHLDQEYSELGPGMILPLRIEGRSRYTLKGRPLASSAGHSLHSM